METLQKTLRVLRSLEEHGVDYVVIGGVALNFHGIIRATEDLDIFVRPVPANIERLKEALREVWDDPCIDEITASDLCGEYPAVRYGPPEDGLYLDILTRLGELVRYDDLEVQTLTIGAQPVRVVTPRCLYELKRGTVRPIDHADVVALAAHFELDEE